MMYAPLNTVGWPDWYLRKSCSSYKTSNPVADLTHHPLIVRPDGLGGIGFGGAGWAEIHVEALPAPRCLDQQNLARRFVGETEFPKVPVGPDGRKAAHDMSHV